MVWVIWWNILKNRNLRVNDTYKTRNKENVIKSSID